MAVSMGFMVGLQSSPGIEPGPTAVKEESNQTGNSCSILNFEFYFMDSGLKGRRVDGRQEAEK